MNQRRSLTSLMVVFVLCSGGTAAQETRKAEPTTQPKVKPTESPSALMDPGKATEKAPEHFTVKFATTKGDFEVEVTRDWAPEGADRFYNLVKIGFYKDIAFFRVIDNFMAQFGIHGDPKVTGKWKTATIQDDPVVKSNTRGYLTYAKTGMPNSRTTQLFVNYGDNSRLDGMGFAPFGVVKGDGMKILDSIYKKYGEGAPRGRGPSQGRIQSEGNKYLKAEFPELDYLKNVTLVEN